MTDRRPSIGIVGGGVAGLAAAALLRADPTGAGDAPAVTVFEQSPALGPVGAGLLLQAAGRAVLDRIGVLGEVARKAERIEEIHATTRRGRTLVRLRYAEIAPGGHALGVHRADLFAALHRAAIGAGATVSLGRRVVRHRQDAGAVWAGDDRGEWHGPFDLLVAADGSASEVRASSGIPHRTFRYRHAAAWASGPCPASARGRLVQATDGTRGLCGVLPTGVALDGTPRASVFWGTAVRDWPATLDAGFDRWRDRVVALNPAAADVLSSARGFGDVVLGGYRHVWMRRWHAGRLGLIGDAAHGTSPHLGQGANLALLDAAGVAASVAALGPTSRGPARLPRTPRRPRRLLRRDHRRPLAVLPVVRPARPPARDRPRPRPAGYERRRPAPPRDDLDRLRHPPRLARRVGGGRVSGRRGSRLLTHEREHARPE